MRSLLLIFLLLLSQIIFAQKTDGFKQNIRGVVVDKITQMPLPGASIILKDSNPIIGTTSDKNGAFVFHNIDIGRHSLLITFIGFNPMSINNILLSSGKEILLNIQLEEQAFVTNEVVIKADQEKSQVINKMATVSARSFTVEETERYAGSLGDPSRMAANFAGVSMVNDSRNDIIIRGNSPIGILWRLDGVEIPNPNHFSASGTTGGPVSMLNNNLLSNSDFFTSAFPAEYGNAMSGVFDLKMRSGNNQKREYVGQVGFNGFELGAEGPLKKGKQGSYLINYRYSTMGLMSKLGMNSGTGDATPYYQDLSFKIDLPGTKLGRFSLFGIGGLSSIKIYDSNNIDAQDADQNYNAGGSDLDYGSDMGVLGFSHLYFINETTRIKTILSIQGSRETTEIDSLRFDSNGLLIPNSNYSYYGANATEIKYSASTHFKKKINSRNNIIVGAYYDLYNVNYLDSVLDRSPEFSGFRSNIDVKGDISLIRAYAQWQHKFSNKLELNSGLYSQHVEMGNETTLEPRLGLKYKFSNKQSLSVGYGLYSQMQPRVFYFTQTSLDDGTYLRTNENMKLSKSQQYVIAYDLLLNENFRFKTEVYYQDLYDIPVTHLLPEFSVLNSGADFGGLSGDADSLVNTGTGENYGIEFTLEKFLSKNFYFLTTVSLFESYYKGFSGIKRNTAFNNNYIVNGLAGYEFKISAHSRLAIDLKLSYSGGKRYIPIDLESSIKENTTVYDWEKSYENKYDDYFRTDVRLSYKLDWKRINQEWAINFQNISNQQNIFSESYNPRTKKINQNYQLGFYLAFLYRISF